MIIGHKLLAQCLARKTARQVVCWVERRRRVHGRRARLCRAGGTSRLLGARARREAITRSCALRCCHGRRRRVETTQTGVARVNPEIRRVCQQRQVTGNDASQIVVVQATVNAKGRTFTS
jgi:hypothetical protein